MQAELIVIVALCGIAAVGVSIAYWRQAIFAAMILLVFEGALRKWVLPEAQASLYLAKDVILFGAYIGFATARKPRVPVPDTGVPLAVLGVLAVYGAAQIFNPALPTIALGLVGWRAYFFYAPLIFVVPYLFDSIDDMERMLRRFAYLSIPIAVLGLVQFYSPVDSAINLNVQHEEGGGAPIGFGFRDRVRVAGSFSFVSGFAAYLLAVAMLMGALVAARQWRVAGNWALYAGLALTVAAMFATGSRGPVFTLAAAALIFSLCLVLNGAMSISAAVKAALAAAALAVIVDLALPEPADAFRRRAASDEDAWERVTSPLAEPFNILRDAGALGYGIGAAHQSATFITGSRYPYWTDGRVAEAETSKIMLELGLPGFALELFFRVAIALAALRAAFRLRAHAARVMALAIALFLGLQVMASVVFNPTMNLLYWFAIGLLFALHRLDAGSIAKPGDARVPIPAFPLPGRARRNPT